MLKPEECLPNAFEKCGLVPLNRNRVLERLPSATSNQEAAQHIDKLLLNTLEGRRFGNQPAKNRKPRGKKVPAGVSYTAEEDSEEENMEDDMEEEDSNQEEEDSNQEEEEEDNLNSRKKTDDIHLTSPSSSDSEEEIVQGKPSGSRIHQTKLAILHYAVADYEGQMFLAQVAEDQSGVELDQTRLSYMTIKGKNQFSWGEKPDLLVTLNEDIVMSPVNPVPVNSRGHLGLSKQDFEKALRLMVVVYLCISTFIELNFHQISA